MVRYLRGQSPFQMAVKGNFLPVACFSQEAVEYSLETFDDLKVPKVKVSEYFKYPDIMFNNRTLCVQTGCSRRHS
jgi:hypothetical protein